MQVHKYERWWMGFGLAMLFAFLLTIAVAAYADNINPPSGLQSIDPTKVASTPPFDRPGVRKLNDGTYEAYVIAEVFSFTPPLIVVPAGKKVTFYVTSRDVVHGFLVTNTDLNMMAVPGWVNSESHVFRKKGTYLLLCHEYCGIGHQSMFGRIWVK